MKPKLFSWFVIIIAAFMIVLPSNAFSSTYYTGTYKFSTGDIANGLWSETFEDGEGQASPNNLFTALATGVPSWTISGNVKQSAQPADSSSGYDYYTVYNVLFEFTTAGDWGDPFSFSNVDGENYSKRTSPNNLAFNFSTSGIVDNYLFQVEVDFDSSTSGVTYTYDGENAVHSGDPFNEITLTVSQVPIPGAVWLLGSGLIGIVGIRRKIIK